MSALLYLSVFPFSVGGLWIELYQFLSSLIFYTSINPEQGFVGSIFLPPSQKITFFGQICSILMINIYIYFFIMCVCGGGGGGAGGF